MPGGVTPSGGAVNAIRITSGLLPAFAVFDAKGKEGSTDLGVHFGFAPQVNCRTGQRLLRCADRHAPGLSHHRRNLGAAAGGSSYLKASQAEKDLAADVRTENTLISGGLDHQATKSLKLVGEFDYWWTKSKLNGNTPPGLAKNSQWAPVVGAMLFS